jgi:hypothetical protein
MCVVNTVLSAGHAMVVVASAVQTVVLSTDWASVVV